MAKAEIRSSIIEPDLDSEPTNASTPISKRASEPPEAPEDVKIPKHDPLPKVDGKRPVVTASGVERPAFLLKFPRDPELDRLVSAFENGNYALVRTEAVKLAEDTKNPNIREAALELRRRIDPDPTMRYLLLASIALLVFLALFVYSKQSHLH